MLETKILMLFVQQNKSMNHYIDKYTVITGKTLLVMRFNVQVVPN